MFSFPTKLSNDRGVAGFTHHLAFNMIQVPLDFQRGCVFPNIRIQPFRITEHGVHELNLPCKLLANCWVRQIEAGAIGLGPRDSITERFQLRPIGDDHIKGKDADIGSPQHAHAVAGWDRITLHDWNSSPMEGG